MDTNQRGQSDTLLRTAVISGGLVAVAAILGADRLVTASMSTAVSHRSHIVVVRVVGAHPSVRLSSATGLGWTASVALVLLILRRSPLPSGVVGNTLHPGIRVDSSPPSLIHLRRKCAISYRNGGLYGGA
ncbi:MAG: hypothetical protein ACE5EC_03015 [Phycisphaerae bacterium]